MRGYGYDVVAVEGGGGRKERAERRRSERTRILALSQGPVPTFERDGSCARGWIEARHTHKSGQARRLKEPPPLSLSFLFHALFPHAHLADASSFIGSCARTKTTNWPSEHAVTRRCQNKMRYHNYSAACHYYATCTTTYTGILLQEIHDMQTTVPQAKAQSTGRLIEREHMACVRRKRQRRIRRQQHAMEHLDLSFRRPAKLHLHEP